MYRYKVNGVKFRSDIKIISVLQIMRRAKEQGAIARSVNMNDYCLYSDPYTLGLDMYVNLEKSNEFLTLPNDPTLIA